mgnify:CR=1 FL=1
MGHFCCGLQYQARICRLHQSPRSFLQGAFHQTVNASFLVINPQCSVLRQRRLWFLSKHQTGYPGEAAMVLPLHKRRCAALYNPDHPSDRLHIPSSTHRPKQLRWTRRCLPTTRDSGCDRAVRLPEISPILREILFHPQSLSVMLLAIILQELCLLYLCSGSRAP